MKRASIVALIICSHLSLISSEKKDLQKLSVAVNIPETYTFPDGRKVLLSSRSPGNVSNLASRPSSKKNESLKEAAQQLHDESLAIKTADFISTEAILVIKEVIQEKLQGNYRIGDTEIDLELSAILARIKMKNCTQTSESEVALQKPGEESIKFKIRTNPRLANKIDIQIFEMALLLNETIRISSTENKEG